jgi:tetratricopeptide (TPR) repeat protein
VVEGLFKQMLSDNAAANTNNSVVKSAYAEYLSWQAERRPEAMRMYVELAKADPAERDTWEARLEEVLKWHQPTTELIPVYQDIVNLYPQNKAIWLTVARAYRNNKDYYKEAVETYNTLVKRYGDDATIKKEWLGLLLSNESQRDENIRLLKKMVQDEPGDLDILATYGKLLSYQHKYGPAMDAFEKVLNKNPEHREALVGKGYVTLWSGRKLEAKAFFQHLRKQYPDDVDIAIGLAQTDKLIGRYDEAMKIIEEIKPLMDSQQQGQPGVPKGAEAKQRLPLSGDASDLSAGGYRLVGDFSTPSNPMKRRAMTYDFSILPYAADTSAASTPTNAANGTDSSANPPKQEIDETALSPQKNLTEAMPDFLETSEPVSKPVPKALKPMAAATFAPDADANEARSSAPSAPSNDPNLRALHAEVDALSDAANTLKLLQASSAAQLQHLDQTIRTTRDAVPFEMSLQATDDSQSRMASTMQAGRQSGGSVGEAGMAPEYGTYAALDYDTNPLLSGMGRFRNDDLSDLEKGLSNDLRPMMRGGFLYSTQKGERTTTRLNSWGFPNQVSLSLTPQIRVRGGVQPTRWYIPTGVAPDSSWGVQYGIGTTIKYWDRLTLDGDLAITHFSQNKSENFTGQAQLQYDFTDNISAKLGFRRIPQYTSLLTMTGLKPSQGAFSGNLLGQARENGIYGELNTHPFSPNWDWNLGYEWAFVDGAHIPNNYKNQAFTSLGYTWHAGANHEIRLGYELLYFGYSKNATNGFFDTTAAGVHQPVVSLDPVALANSAYVFGGYYSPAFFMMNAARLDLHGSLFNKFLEYKLGGSLGAQTVVLGHSIKEAGNGSSLASSFDANLIMNFTDWLAAYGDVDFLDAGGQFNRWRFGGGLIVRPHIDTWSPVSGQPTSSVPAVQTEIRQLKRSET